MILPSLYFLLILNSTDTTVNKNSQVSIQNHTSDTSQSCNDSLLKKLYQFKTDSLQMTNKDHLYKQDSKTASEIKLKDLEKQGEEQRQSEVRRKIH